MAKTARKKNTDTSSIKLPQLVMTGIVDAENLANAAALERGARWEGKAGIVVEAQPRGYLVYAVDKLSRFEELILEPQIRHWV
jgi:hypothetical protein